MGWSAFWTGFSEALLQMKYTIYILAALMAMATVFAGLTAGSVTTTSASFTSLTLGGLAINPDSLQTSTGVSYVLADGSVFQEKINDVVYVNTLTGLAIQNAIDSLSSTGGKVVLLNQTYIVSTTINLSSNIELQGQGFQTILKGGSMTEHIIRIADSDNVKINNLRIEGNAIANNLGSGTWATDDDTPFAHGIYLSNSDDVTLDTLRINNTMRSSIGLGNNNTRININNIISSNSLADHLLYISEGEGVNVNNYISFGYFAKRSAIRVGSGTIGQFAKFVNLNNIYYTNYTTNPNGYTNSEDVALHVYQENTYATNLNNININLEHNSAEIGGMQLQGNVNGNNIYISGNVSNKNGLYLNNADVNLNNVQFQVFDDTTSGRAIRVRTSDVIGHATSINNLKVLANENGAKIYNGLLTDLVSKNATLSLTNAYFDIDGFGVRLTNTGSTLTYSDFNVACGSTGTCYNANGNQKRLTQKGMTFVEETSYIINASRTASSDARYVAQNGVRTWIFGSRGDGMFGIRDLTANAERFQIDTSGNIGIKGSPSGSYVLEVTGSIQGDDYYSGDGTQGMTGSCGSATTLTIKDGLITACS